MKATRRRWPLRLLVSVGSLSILLLALALLADPLATRLARAQLAKAQDFRLELGAVHVHFFPPGVEILDFKAWKRDTSQHPPHLNVFSARAWIDVQSIIRERPVLWLRVERPKVTVVRKVPQIHVPNLSELPAILVERMEVVDAEMVFIDGAEDSPARIWVHKVDGVLEKFATRPALSEGWPTVVALSGTVARSGTLSAFGTLDVFTPKVSFDIRTSIERLQLAELNELVTPRTDLSLPTGTFSCFVELRVRNGALSGTVKPVLKDVLIRPGHKDFGNVLKAAFMDAAFHLAERKSSDGERKLSTVIALSGKLDAPQALLWPALAAALRNAWVEGLAEGFAGAALPQKPAVDPHSLKASASRADP